MLLRPCRFANRQLCRSSSYPIPAGQKEDGSFVLRAFRRSGSCLHKLGQLFVDDLDDLLTGVRLCKTCSTARSFTLLMKSRVTLS